jgi:hypothetical protein
MEMNAIRRCAGTLKNIANALRSGRILHEDVHVFDLRKITDYVCVYPRDRLKFTGPIL